MRRCTAAIDHNGDVKQCELRRGHDHDSPEESPHLVCTGAPYGDVTWSSARQESKRRCRDRCSWDNTRCELRRAHDGQHRAHLGKVTESRWDPSSSAAPAPPSLFAALAGAAGFGQVVLGLVNLARGEVFIALVQFGIGTVGLSFWAPKLWRYRNGSREAVGDCERAGTDTDDRADPNYQALIAAYNATFASTRASRVGAPVVAGKPGGQLIFHGNPSWPVRSKISFFNNTYAHDHAGEDVRLQERDGDLPLLAFKSAVLVWKVGGEFGPALVSAYGSVPWGATEAVCTAGGVHERIPDEGCTCGFYGRRSPDDVDDVEGGTRVLVDVELYGRVIVYERGYRAERQRLLRIGLAPCWYCHADATVVGGNAPTPSVYEQRNGVGQTVATHTEAAEPAELFPFCDAHVDLSATNLRMTVPELSVRLGVPVDTVHTSA